MLKLAAYANRLSVQSGQTIRFHAANSTDQKASARLVRVICADPNPAGPGIQLEPVASEPVELRPATEQSVPLGSYGRFSGTGQLFADNDKATPGSFTLSCRLFPTRPGVVQCLLSVRDVKSNNPIEGNGFELGISAEGGLMINHSQESRSVTTLLPFKRWSLIWVRWNHLDKTFSCGWHPCDRPATTAQLAAKDAPEQITDHNLAAECQTELQSDELTRAMLWPAHAELFLATAPADAGANSFERHFNGRMEQLILFGHALNHNELLKLTRAFNHERVAALAQWDFSQDTDTRYIRDIGPAGLDGSLFNAPVRAVAGSHWNGRFMQFSQAPEHYGAIHFHDDDLADCQWPVVYEWAVPANTRSGIYALWLDAGEHHDNVPFHVVPAPGQKRARIAVLASTYTYTVYGNNARPEWEADSEWQHRWREQSRDWKAYPHNPGDHHDYGLSTYNLHNDGAGISLVTWLRPMLNVRVGYVTFPDPEIRASGLRHFPADTHLTAWLEHCGYGYDIITDSELNEQGLPALEGYEVVLTGSHPEYHTREMLEALTAYRDSGGRFCYLGGNGFYWKIALDPSQDGVIEIRRGEGGIRAWASEPGEYYNQLDGEYGGLWRRNGHPPQQLTGVGFSAQGNFSGSHYRLTEQAHDPRVSWMFKDITGPLLGGHGLSAHGAAGFELDRADVSLGTPVDAIVVARSENHPPEAPWILVPEEMLTHLLTLPREPAQSLVRADMTFFSLPSGGAVFSTGSITFCGSLPSHHFDNDISQLMRNVVDRFLDPAPFDASR